MADADNITSQVIDIVVEELGVDYSEVDETKASIRETWRELIQAEIDRQQ